MEFTKDKLKVKVFDTREKMGQVAGEDALTDLFVLW